MITEIIFFNEKFSNNQKCDIPQDEEDDELGSEELEEEGYIEKAI